MRQNSFGQNTNALKIKFQNAFLLHFATSKTSQGMELNANLVSRVLKYIKAHNHHVQKTTTAAEYQLFET